MHKKKTHEGKRTATSMIKGYDELNKNIEKNNSINRQCCNS